MSAKSDLKHSIIQLLKHNKDGSFKTQANRKERLLFISKQLNEKGYKIRHIKQLKLKHIQYLVTHWLEQGLSPGTIKNRMTDLRWAMKKFGKEDIIPSKNDTLNIPKRQYVTKKDKSINITEGDLSKIMDMNVKMSLLLQREFGLRREESIKINIQQAVVGNELQLRGSWCKNGRPRTIKINYPEQWEVIKKVKEFLGKENRSLIPPDKTYIQQQHLYDNQLKKAGINKAHGLRHAYAQKRYHDLTGWACLAKGGPPAHELTPQQQKLDKEVRLLVSRELGHNRPEILAVYCA